MAPMPLTGTIGATATGQGESGSNRRALPDQVTSFFLPTIERSKEQLANVHQVKPVRQRGRRSTMAIKQQEQDAEQRDSDEHGDDDDDDLLNVESSLTLLQSLRQARLTHLTALLPYLSTRHRTSTKYHPAPAGMVYPGGLDPVASPPPTLLHLGRADVRVGPFVFPRTRFGEARVEGVMFESAEAAKAGQPSTAAAPTQTQIPVKAATGKAREVDTAASTPSKAAPAALPTVKPDSQISTPAAAKLPSASTPTTSSKPPPASAVMTRPANATPASSNPGSAVASPSRTSGQATPTVAATAAAPINDKVVKAVSAAAQRDPALQRLLHAAANGKATAEQLRELAAFIAKVSEGLEKEAQLQHKEAQRILDAAAGITTPSTSTLKAASSTTASPSAMQSTKKMKKKPRVSAASDAAEKPMANSGDAGTARIPAPSSAYTSIPPYPPIVTIEYRENPSARFVLPLWRGATVERRVLGGERSVKVTMLLPAIGSSAAVRAGAKDEAESGATTKSGKPKAKAVAKKAALAPDGSAAAAAAASTPPTTPAKQAGDAATPRKLPTSEELRAPAPAGAETRAITWTITGTSEGPLSDGIWFVFGRVEGATTFVDGVPQLDQEEKATAPATATAPLSEQVLTALINKIRLLPSRMRDCERTPKLRLAPDEVPRDLPDHLTDRFAPRVQILASRPIVRIKRGTGGAGEDGEDQFEIVRSTVYADTKPGKRARFQDGGGGVDDNEGDATTMTWDGDESIMSVDASGKPKRKRHVAKFNPDGTLKLCQACGTNSTPMWRRGPAGKSTLCNACGAKWKVGRLVVPDQPPTMPPPADEGGAVSASPRKRAPKAASAGVTSAEEKADATGQEEVPAQATTSTGAQKQSDPMQVDPVLTTGPPLQDTTHTTTETATTTTTKEGEPVQAL